MPRINLDTLNLAKGGHQDPEDGLCLLEAVAYVTDEDHSDHPACVSPILAAFGRDLNDRLDDAKRQQLKPLIPLLPGTAGDGLDEARGYLALDWLIRTYTAAWLDLAGLTTEAAELRALRRIVDLAAAQAAGPVVVASREKARERAAARDAAWAAARAAAGAAAWDAARAAAGDAAWDAAGAAARDAAWAAARAAAGDAARDAARDALKPTVEQLQTSAIDLFGRMVKPSEENS